MSSASNPFRRSGTSSTTSPPPLPQLSTSAQYPSSHIAYQQLETPQNFGDEAAPAPKKVVKRVRVQSPPPLSPDTPYSASSIGDENFNIFANPTPATLKKDDSFDTKFPVLDAEGGFQPSSRAPPNPFSRTLETLESSGREEQIPTPQTNAPGKGTMDVDAFKRMLMTGKSGLEESTPPAAAPAQTTLGLGDNSSSTDTSSISRHSMSDAPPEVHLDSPRTSHEISEPEDDRRMIGTDFTTSIGGRKKPPPPSSRHGKLIKVELRDENSSVSLQSPESPSTRIPPTYFPINTGSTTDLNKPLPPAPRRSSHDLEDESVFDREAAGKIPDPPSPSSLTPQRKKPPTPPLARRHSQLVSESKLTRSNSGRLSPKPEEDAASIKSIDTTTGISRSNSTRAPPPPPSRRPASIRNSSMTSPPQATPFPAPPPARGSSRSISGRPPSISGVEGPTSTQSKRISMIPPPPPPHRHGRSSMDGASPGSSQRPSGEFLRKSGDFARRGSTASSLNQIESAIAAEPEQTLSPALNTESYDVLADLNALQREIDALRGGSSKQAENTT